MKKCCFCCAPLVCSPVDCAGVWSDWGACSTTCGPGTQERQYTVTDPGNPPLGAACPAAPQEIGTQDCQVVPCPIDCDGDYAPWTPCSATCGTGTQTSSFMVSQAAMYGGADCPAGEHFTRIKLSYDSSCGSMAHIANWPAPQIRRKLAKCRPAQSIALVRTRRGACAQPPAATAPKLLTSSSPRSQSTAALLARQ